MNGDICPVHVFRSQRFAPSGDTWTAAACLERVGAVYGAGGMFGEGGLSAAFGGAVVFRDEDTGQFYLGVWGARNVSRFRVALGKAGPMSILSEPPPARLMFYETRRGRPKRPVNPESRQLRSHQRSMFSLSRSGAIGLRNSTA